MNRRLHPGAARPPVASATPHDSRALRAGLAMAALMAALPASAVTPTPGSIGSARTVTRSATVSPSTTTATVNRDGVIQRFDAAAQRIIINGSQYTIGPPLLALLDKRANTNGLLTFADLKVGMFVRFRVDNERVVELWVLRDPQQTGTR